MRRGRRRVLALVLAGSAVLLGLAAFAAVALLRSPPPVSVVAVPLPQAFPGHLARLAWPAKGESALAVQGIGFMGSHGPDRPVAIASVAKVMTALLVLRDHPLHPGASGPTITVTPADVDIYRSDLAAGQSVARVRAGEQLTERQALEALLLPSANNVATLLAEWDAGSEGAFVARMNARARALGLAHTRYSDASGFDPATVSTARDQVRLALAALRLPAFDQIVATRQVRLPVAGVEHNLDELLGRDGIVGVKTGTTSTAGGCFVLATRIPVAGRMVTVVGAVLGQPSTPGQPSILKAALDSARALARSLPRVLKGLSAVAPGGTLARLTTPWAQPVPVGPRALPPLVGWPGLPVRISILARQPLRAPVGQGERVGWAVIAAGGQRARVQLLARGELRLPSLGWRLAHP